MDDVHERLDNLLLACVFLLVACVIVAAAHMRNVRLHEKMLAGADGYLQMTGRLKKRRAHSTLADTFVRRVFPSCEQLPANILAGVVAGLKQSLGCVVFSSMVYSSCEQCFPELLAVFPKGLSVNLMSSTLGVILSTTMSKYGGLVSPQDIPAMLLSRIAEVLTRRVREEQLEHTVLACTWISALVFGILCTLAGYFRAGRIVRNIPCPVVDGFVAATGAMAVRSALTTLCRTSFHSLWPTNLATFTSLETWLHIFVGLLSLICIRYLAFWVKDRLQLKSQAVNALLNPISLLVPFILFYAILAVRGHVGEDLAFLRQRRWVYPEVAQQPFWKFYSECYPKSHLNQVSWDDLLQTEVLFLMAMLQFLSLIAAVLNIVGMKNRVEGAEDMDLDRELMVLGIQNILIGVSGGTPSFHKLGMSVNIVRDGGSHKLADLVSALFTGLVFLSGLSVSPYIPKFFLAAIFLNLGIEFTKDHLLDKFGRMSVTDYGTTLVVVLLAMTKDMTWAVAGGCVLQVAILVMISSTLDPIRLKATTDTMMSTRLRTLEERRMLVRSRQIEVVCLRGPLFFGIAANLVTEIEDLLDGLELAPAHIILDLGQVTAFDHSAAEAFMRIHHTADRRGTTLNIVGADEWRWLLIREGLVSPPSLEAGETDGQPALDAPAPGSSRLAAALQDKRVSGIQDYGLLAWTMALAEEQPAEVGLAQWFHSLDAALEDCEDKVLDSLEGERQVTRTRSGRLGTEWEETPDGVPTVPKLFYPVSVGEDLNDSDIVAMSGMRKEEWAQLMAECETIMLTRGQYLYRGGDLCEALYILEMGSLKITPASGQGVARQVSALALIGSEALVMKLGLRNEEAVATSQNARVWKLTQERLDAMRKKKQELYISFTDLRARALCTNRGALTE